jgi:hypothetical protein
MARRLIVAAELVDLERTAEGALVLEQVECLAAQDAVRQVRDLAEIGWAPDDALSAVRWWWVCSIDHAIGRAMETAA